MSALFQEWQRKIADAIASRTISIGPKKAQEYEAGHYHPFFSLVDRQGELVCIWCRNIKKQKGGYYRSGVDGRACYSGPDRLPSDDVEIIRLSGADVTKGLGTKADSSIKHWDSVTRLVMEHFKAWPHITQRAFGDRCESDPLCGIRR